MKKVLITQALPASFVSKFDYFVSKLKERGFEVHVDTKIDSPLSEEEVIARAPGLFAHICGVDNWTAKALSFADSLEVISRIGVGVDSIDISEATRRGVAILTTPGAGAESVSEQAFAMMLAVSRKLLECDRHVRIGKWERILTLGMHRKTLGIIGIGKIGLELSRIVSGFEMEIIAFDPYANVLKMKEKGIKIVDLTTLLKNSDYISLHLPLTSETKGLIGEKEIKMMKSTAIIINCARGGIIDENALFIALRDHRIYGAGFDVFEKEPVSSENPLLKLDNVLLSPHNAPTTVEGKNRVFGEAVNNFLDFIDGKTPSNLVNPEYLDFRKP